jgi:uncharacterized protein (DUF983 family)
MSESESLASLQKFWPVAMRGLRMRCPNCGVGSLFQSYLKQKPHCAECSEALGHIRADDGPAWLTILIVGHILAPFMLAILPNSTLSDAANIAIWSGLSIMLMALLLPRFKGLFIAIIWRTKCVGAEK